MSSTVNTSYPEYPVFKGLQRPLEFMGLRGRYIYWAAVTAGCAILSFIVVYSLLGFVVGLVVLTVIAAVGIALIILKQMKGLHSSTGATRRYSPTIRPYLNKKIRKYNYTAIPP